MTYVALRTVSVDGTMLTDQPTSGRIIATSENYGVILDVCRRHRTFMFRHRVSGEERTVVAAEVTGRTPEGSALMEWVRGAELVKRGEYAIPVTAGMLPTFEPSV